MQTCSKTEWGGEKISQELISGADLPDTHAVLRAHQHSCLARLMGKRACDRTEQCLRSLGFHEYMVKESRQERERVEISTEGERTDPHTRGLPRNETSTAP